MEQGLFGCNLRAGGRPDQVTSYNFTALKFIMYPFKTYIGLFSIRIISYHFFCFVGAKEGFRIPILIGGCTAYENLWQHWPFQL
jgi:hypothetical protein